MLSSYLERILGKLSGHLFRLPEARAILGNTGWLVADKVLRLSIGIAITAWIARYLGPQQFGTWNFVIALMSIFGAVASLGLDSIVVKHLVCRAASAGDVLGTAAVLRVISGSFAMSAGVLTIALMRVDDQLALQLAAITGVAFIVQVPAIVDLHFQAHLRSKYSVLAFDVAFLISSALKLVLLVCSAPLLSFAAASLLEIGLGSLFALRVYRMSGQVAGQWRWKPRLAAELLTASWPLILSSMAAMLYMRIDQIMLAQLRGDEEVGIYSAAVRISECWYFLPMAFIASTFPMLLNSINSSGTQTGVPTVRMSRLFSMVVGIAVVTAIPMSLLSNSLVTLLYGSHYSSAGPILAIHVWAGVFVFLGVASSRWLIAHNLQRYVFYRSVLGAVLNIALNFVLIPRFGGIGAAWATLASQFVASVLANGFNRSTRPVFFIQMAALTAGLSDRIDRELKRTQ